MLLRRLLLLAATLLGISCCPVRALAQEATVIMNAAPSVIMADGRSATTITATVTGLNGEQVPDGTIVRFATTAGELSVAAVASAGGIARVTLTSSPVPGYATVTANFIAASGSGNGQFQVEFTSDKDLANSDQGEADWIRVASSDYLAYSSDSLVIDASASDRGVKFSYRGLIIVADALQADMSNGQVRARNAVLQRGKEQLRVRMLAYSLLSGTGEALSDNVEGARTVQTISVNGADLSQKTLAHQDFNPSLLQFVDISDSRVLITASAVAVRMNDTIQLKHATVYLDSKRVVSMPYQIMPLRTSELFGQQLVGYGTDGLFLDIPYYASVSPKSTGTFYLRSVAASEQDGTYYSGRAGLALDYVEKYGTFDGRTTGTMSLMGLTRHDWGASWTHTEQFNNSLRGYFYFDVPEHNSLFADTNLVQQMHGFSINMTATQTNTPAVQGYSTSDSNVNTYLQTSSHLLSGNQVHGFFYSTALTMQNNVIRSIVPGEGESTQTISTRGAGVNLFSSPVKLSSTSSLSDSFNVTESSATNTGVSGTQATAVLNMTTRFNSLANAGLSYSFSHDPVSHNQVNTVAQPVAATPIVDQSNYSLSFNLTPRTNRWNSSIVSTVSEPLGAKSLSAGLNFFPTSVWSLSVNESYSDFAGLAYGDLEFSIGRRIGSREMLLDWSSINRRFSFNMGSATF